MLRAVLDANIIISALIRPDSTPGRIMRAAIIGTHLRMVASASLLSELRAALAYKRLQRFLKMNPREQDEFVVVLEQVCDLVSITGYQALAICRDPTGLAAKNAGMWENRICSSYLHLERQR